MASSMSSPALSSDHSNNLLEILRRANAHYSRIAATMRVSIHPTHHARKRAAALKLTVSIQKALKLDPKQISTIPLPIIDRVISPPTNLSKAVVVGERELTRTSHPPLKCISSPSPLSSSATLRSCEPLRPQKTQHDQCLTSRWSMSPIEADSDVAQELPEGIAITCNPDYDQDMLLCSPTEGGESVRFTVKLPPQLELFPPRDSNNYLDIPPLGFMRPLSWISDLSSLAPSGPGSASTTSSHGPATPQNEDGVEKLTIRIKRKSSEIDDTLEKRPKYNRKGWTISHRRIVQRPVPLRSGRF